MSGIYVFFDRDGRVGDLAQEFKRRTRDAVTTGPGTKMSTVSNQYVLAATCHHGIYPSGGVAQSGPGLAAVSGACWTHPDHPGLATPSEILELFASGNSQQISPVRGVFSLAYHNGATNELVVETDRFGAMPLYYRIVGNSVRVASELKFLVERGSDRICREALAEVMSLGYMPGLLTLVEGIRRIAPNSRLVFGQNGIEEKPNPTIGYPRNRPVTDEVIDEYHFRVNRFLDRYKGAAGEYSISMSGGLDSRLIGAAALAKEFPVRAFTIGEPGALDARIAEKVAGLMGIPIHNHKVSGESFPEVFNRMVWITESRVMPDHMHYMSAQLSGEVPPGPQLHGLAGETVMGGHLDNPDLVGSNAQVIREACFKSAVGLNYWPKGTLQSVVRGDLVGLVEGARVRAVEEMMDRMSFGGSYSDFVDFRYRFRMESFSNPCLMSQVLPWSDVVCPFLDTDDFDFGARLDLKGIGNRAGQLRWGLRHYPIIKEEPRVKAGVLIGIMDDDPEAFDKGMKALQREQKLKYYLCRLTQGRLNIPNRQSFPYYGQWYRRWNVVREYVDGILLDDRTYDRGLFDRATVEKLLSDCRIGRNTWGALSTVLLLEVFFRQFLDESE